MHDDSEWQRKGATLTDGTAQEEYGLTRNEIVQAIRAGNLRYREASIYGNPCFRLLRNEVEAFVEEQHGRSYLDDRRAKTELASINRQFRRLKKQIAVLEERKSELMGGGARRREGPNKAAAPDPGHGAIQTGRASDDPRGPDR